MVEVEKTGAFNVLVGKTNEILQDAIGAPLRYLVNWGRLYSLWPVHLETACCTPPDTIILGDNKPISDYSPGDGAAGFSGHVGVTKVFSRTFEGSLLKISGGGMLPILVTPEHPILTVNRHLEDGQGGYSETTRWKMASELVASPRVKGAGRLGHRTGDHDCLLIPRISGSLDVRTLELSNYEAGRGSAVPLGRGESAPLELPLNLDVAWMLGMYVARGRTSGVDDLFFGFGQDEGELLGRVDRVASSLGCHEIARTEDTAAGASLGFSAGIISRALRDWCGSLPENKKMPDFILYHKDDEILKTFLSGCVDGRGATAEGSPGYESVTSSSRTLAQQVQLAYARLGLLARVGKGHGRRRTVAPQRGAMTEGAYQVRIQMDSESADFHVQRDSIAVPIRSISEVPYSGRVNNLETTDNTYLISNAVVHNCSVEVGAAGGARFDMERFGVLEAFGSLRQCDLLIVMGTVTRKLAPRLKLIYDQMPEPRWVVAMGACSITGGLYFDSYNVLRGIDDIIPVDVYIPGCPPRAEAFMQGLVLLQEKIRASHSIGGRD